MAPRHPDLQQLDIAVLRFLVRAGLARADALVTWTGASPWTIRASLRRLTAHDLVRSRRVTMQLLGADGRLREAAVFTWTATKAGATVLKPFPHHVPGTEMRLHLGAPKVAASMVDHTCGVAGLAAWYAYYGMGDIAFERDIVRLERPNTIAGQRRQTVVAWTVTVPGMRGVHPPDLAVVLPDGRKYAIELERKVADDYAPLLRAYQQAGIGMIWHVQTKLAWTRLIDAAARSAIQWGPSPAPGVNVSVDGQLRIQGWAPGKVLGGPATWATVGNVPMAPPAGFPAPVALVDRSASWRLGRTVDPDVEALWAPVDLIDAA